MNNNEADRILNDFVLNREALSELDPYVNEVNIFGILKLREHEIRHSNVLAWLLDPKGSHGIGDSFIKLFVSYVIRNNTDKGYNVMGWSYLDYSDCEVIREKHWKDTGKADSLDIMVRIRNSDGREHLIAIENKINSKEGNGQTQRYRENIERECPGAVKMYVYLNTSDEVPEDPEWSVLSYESIYRILGHIKNNCRMKPEAGLIIKNYRKVCADIMDITDEALREKVKKIYRENKAAIDLINKYKPDIQWDIADYLRKLLRNERLKEESENPGSAGNIQESHEPAKKSRVRFTTGRMDKYISPSSGDISCWGTDSNYCYEFSFRPDKGKLTISFTMLLNVKNIDDKLMERGDRIRELMNYQGKKSDSVNFRIAFKPIISKEISEEDDPAEWEPVVDDYFARVIRTVKELEKKIPDDVDE